MPSEFTATGATEQVAFACDFPAARAASRKLTEFLAAHHITNPILFACEVALTEACNNAVQHVGEAGRSGTILARVAITAARIELSVTDHTGGFTWPTSPPEPPPADAEHGRGVFLIRSLMDGATYTAGSDGNTLVMWKARPE